MVSLLVLYHLLLFQIFTFHTEQRCTICEKKWISKCPANSAVRFLFTASNAKVIFGARCESQSPLWHHKGLTSRNVSFCTHFLKSREKNGTPFQAWGVDWQDTCIFWKRWIKLRNNWTYWDYYELAALLSHHRLLHGWLLRFKWIKFMQSKNLLLFLTKWPISNINQKPDEWGQLTYGQQKSHQNDQHWKKTK